MSTFTGSAAHKQREDAQTAETLDVARWMKETFRPDDELVMNMGIEGAEYEGFSAAHFQRDRLLAGSALFRRPRRVRVGATQVPCGRRGPAVAPEGLRSNRAARALLLHACNPMRSEALGLGCGEPQDVLSRLRNARREFVAKMKS